MRQGRAERLRFHALNLAWGCAAAVAVLLIGHAVPAATQIMLHLVAGSLN